MNIVHQILPVAGQVLLMAVLLAMLAEKLVTDVRKRKLIVAVLLVSGLFVPVNGLSISQWLRSALGDLSVITLVIMLNILLRRLYYINIINELSMIFLLSGVALVGVVFYPLALGLSALDPYHFGYAPVWISVMLALVSVVSWLKGLRDLAVILLLPLLAFNLRLLESANLWDYLLDPVLMIYAVVQSAAYIWNSRFSRQGA